MPPSPQRRSTVVLSVDNGAFGGYFHRGLCVLTAGCLARCGDSGRGKQCTTVRACVR